MIAEPESVDSSRRIVFDPASPENFANPFPLLRLIQEREPLLRSTIGWIVTRYEHAVTTLRESKVWGAGMTAERRKAIFGSGPMFEYGSRRMSSYDPPQHTRLRSLVTKAFTAQRVEALRPRIQKLADDLLRVVDGAHEFDVLEALAHPLPCQVICELIGVPLSDSTQLSRWTVVVHSVLAPVARPELLSRANQAADDFMSYIRALVTKRRTTPGEDLLSALIAAEEAGERLTEEELVATVLFIFTAGHATTRDLTGTACWLHGES